MLIVGCSSPSVDAGAAPSSSEAVKPTPLAYFEGSFDPVARSLTVTTRKPNGEIVTEDTLPYGEGAGDVYLHTCGTNGDGYSFGVWAPPTYGTFGPSSNAVTWSFAPMNGTGAAINDFTVNFDEVAPTGVGVFVYFGNTSGSCSTSGPVVSVPCSATLTGTNPLPVTPDFPSAIGACASVSVLAAFDDSANGGAGFSFSGHITGN